MFEAERIQIQLAAIEKVIACELGRVKDALHFLAGHSAYLFRSTSRDPDAVDAWLRDAGFGLGEDGFFLSLPLLRAFRDNAAPPDAISHSWPPDRVADPDARYRMYCHRDMGPVLRTIHDRLPGAAWIYYQDVTNTAFQYPYIDQITAITPDFQWSDYHTYQSVEPGVNPGREERWAPPHIDYAGQGLIVAASIPVYVDDAFVGLWSIDIGVDSLVRHDILATTLKDQLICVVEREGTVVASSRGMVTREMEKGEIATVDFASHHAAFADIPLDGLFESGRGNRLFQSGDDRFLVHWTKIECMDWLCVTVVGRNELLSTGKEYFRRAFNNLGAGMDEALVELSSLPEELSELGVAYNRMVSKLRTARENLLQQQQELSREKARAVEASHAKSLFLANMSHELRTPLNGIMGTQQLLGATELTQEQAEYVDMAMQSSRRLANLLGDILDLTKVETGNMRLEHKPFDLAETLDHVRQLFGPTCRQKGVELVLELGDDVPGTLSGDPVRLQQILNNLVGNAVKFTPGGRILCQAHLLPYGKADQCRVLFTVRDTGIGMKDDELGKIFEVFTQADEGSRRSYQGAGLGLAIVRQLVRLMHGTIAVENDPGNGSAFHLSLPFDLCEERTDTAPQPEPVRIEPSPYKILLVEDEPVNRTAVRAILEKTGYRADAVTNGREALDALSAEGYDLVLMDIQMPIMDGVEATRAIRSGAAGKDKTDIPIVALTAYAMAGDRENFLRAGVDAYLAKPVEHDQLTLLIGELLAEEGGEAEKRVQ